MARHISKGGLDVHKMPSIFTTLRGACADRYRAAASIEGIDSFSRGFTWTSVASRAPWQAKE